MVLSWSGFRQTDRTCDDFCSDVVTFLSSTLGRAGNTGRENSPVSHILWEKYLYFSCNMMTLI